MVDWNLPVLLLLIHNYSKIKSIHFGAFCIQCRLADWSLLVLLVLIYNYSKSKSLNFVVFVTNAAWQIGVCQSGWHSFTIAVRA